MNSLTNLGKYLDQPRLINLFSKAVPTIMVVGGTGYALNQVRKSPKETKRDVFIQNVSVLTGTMGAALAGPSLASKIFGAHGHEHHHEHEHENVQVTEHEHGHEHAHEECEHCIDSMIDKYIERNPKEQEAIPILKKAKEKILSFSEIKTIFEKLYSKADGKKLLNHLIPNPEHIDSGHIFGEIGRLSIIGLLPVLGGVLGGIVGDKATDKNWKEKIPNKIKEGSYQYLANIFLCNIGAGVALLAMEKAKITSKSSRAFGMIGGIILAGIVGGSTIANYVGQKIIDPLFGLKNNKGLYSERKPEALDFGLHIDDVSVVAVLSGLKWIEPALPILYSISGYRAGIGYRNNNESKA